MSEPDDLLRLFQSITTTDHDTLISQFAKLLQVDTATSAFFLESSNWNVETAANTYLATVGTQNPFLLREENIHPQAFTQPEAKFLSDLSEAQTAQFLPHQQIQLQLNFLNSGNARWPSNVSLVLSQGYHFSVPTHIDVENNTEPGAQVQINLHLTMPGDSGTHYGTWRLMWEGGYFGDPVWVVLTVVDPIKEKVEDMTMDTEDSVVMDDDMDVDTRLQQHQEQDMEL